MGCGSTQAAAATRNARPLGASCSEHAARPGMRFSCVPSSRRPFLPQSPRPEHPPWRSQACPLQARRTLHTYPRRSRFSVLMTTFCGLMSACRQRGGAGAGTVRGRRRQCKHSAARGCLWQHGKGAPAAACPCAALLAAEPQAHAAVLPLSLPHLHAQCCMSAGILALEQGPAGTAWWRAAGGQAGPGARGAAGGRGGRREGGRHRGQAQQQLVAPMPVASPQLGRLACLRLSARLQPPALHPTRLPPALAMSRSAPPLSRPPCSASARLPRSANSLTIHASYSLRHCGMVVGRGSQSRRHAAHAARHGRLQGSATCPWAGACLAMPAGAVQTLSSPRKQLCAHLHPTPQACPGQALTPAPATLLAPSLAQERCGR